MKNRGFRNMTVFMLIALLVVAFYGLGVDPGNQPEELTFNQLMDKAAAGEISELVVQPDNNDSYMVTGKFTDGTEFTTTVPMDYTIVEELSQYVAVDFQPAPVTPWWTNLLMTLIPMLLVMAVLIFFLQQTQGGGGKVMQFGKSRAKLNTDEKKKVTFDDVAGVDEVKEELAEVVDFLRSPRKYTQLGAKIPKGVLLYGPPGTGKTLLARAVAGESGVPFFTISGSDFVEMFVGVGASRVRDLFDQAKKNAPCIIFIDEIDAVGRQRGAGLGGGHDEREQTLNQLLVEMDGFSANEGIIVMAGTNRPDILDPALLRPGRFDRQIAVGYPDVRGREAIIKVHAKGKPLENGVDFAVLAKRTPGFTGADLANMVNEAALLAARKNKITIGMEEMEAAIERVMAGPEKKSRVMSESEKKLVSYHEAGHAVVSYYLKHADPVHKVSIIPRGGAGGYTLLLPEEDSNYNTKSKMLDELVLFLGGRTAELLVLKEISTGAQNDLERATNLARQMITRYGMSDELGPITFGRQEEQVFLGRDISHERNYSEAVAYAIDKEAKAMMDEAYDRAKKILSQHMDKLEAVAQALMAQETIDSKEFYQIMDGSQPPQQSGGSSEQGAPPADGQGGADTADGQQQPPQAGDGEKDLFAPPGKLPEPGTPEQPINPQWSITFSNE